MKIDNKFKEQILSDIRAEAFKAAVRFINYELVPGDICEFGCYTGRSLASLTYCHQKYFQDENKHNQKSSIQRKVYGFDSFEGLPEKWRNGFEKGCFTKEKGHLHPDHLWFDDKPLAHYEEWATETFNSDVVTTFIRHLFTSKYTLSRRGNQHCREFQKLCKNAEVDDVIGACAYAIAHGHENNWNMFKHILKSGVFKSLPATSSSIPSNSIIRGGHYFENAGVQL